MRKIGRKSEPFGRWSGVLDAMKQPRFKWLHGNGEVEQYKSLVNDIAKFCTPGAEKGVKTIRTSIETEAKTLVRVN